MQTAFGRTTFSTPGRISREPRGGEETGETAGESSVTFGILDDLVRGAPAPAANTTSIREGCNSNSEAPHL